MANAGGDAPFVIAKPLNGMHRVTVVDRETDATVRDLKLALQAKTDGAVPASEAVLVSNVGAMPDHLLLRDVVRDFGWIMLIHRPPVAEDGAAAADVDEPAQPVLARAASAPPPAGMIRVPFFYCGVVQHIDVPLDATIDHVLREYVGERFRQAFGDDPTKVVQPERLGIYLESCLLPRDSLVSDAAESLTAAPLVPVVHDLVTTRARNQNIPANAFQTDCSKCKTTGIQAKVR